MSLETIKENIYKNIPYSVHRNNDRFFISGSIPLEDTDKIGYAKRGNITTYNSVEMAEQSACRHIDQFVNRYPLSYDSLAMHILYIIFFWGE